MPIKVSCKCGQSFTAKDDLIGQTLLCPKCHQPLTIGESGEKHADSRQASGGISDLFDEVGLKEVKGPRCPQCGAGMGKGVVLCVGCGFHLEKRETIRAAEVRGKVTDGYQEAAGSMLKRAEKQIAYDKIEDRKNQSQGAPAWMIFLVLSIVVGFAVTMYLLPRDIAVTYTGIAVMGLGVLMQIVCNIRLLIVAFKDNLTQGLLCLLVPFYIFIYVAMHWRNCRRIFTTFLSMFLVIALGAGLVRIAPIFAIKEEGARLETHPPAFVVASASFHEGKSQP